MFQVHSSPWPNVPFSTILAQLIYFLHTSIPFHKANNGVGSSRSVTIRVQVQSKPFFTEKPLDQNGAEEDVAEVVCAANGNPKPQIRLFRNGVPIDEVPLLDEDRWGEMPQEWF